MTGANAKIKRIMIGDKKVRPATYEYSYDFRGKTKTQVTNDGWSAGSGDGGTGCGADGLYAISSSPSSPGRLLGTIGKNFTGAKKIINEALYYFSPNSDTGDLTIGICTTTARAGGTWSYTCPSNGNSNISVGGNSKYDVSLSLATSSDHTVKRELDLVNKTVKWYIDGTLKTTQSVTDAEITTVNSSLYYNIMITGNNKLKTFTFTIEY